MSVKLLTKHNLEFLSLKGGCTGSSESTLIKMPHCWKSHVATHLKSHLENSISSTNTICWVEGVGGVKLHCMQRVYLNPHNSKYWIAEHAC